MEAEKVFTLVHLGSYGRVARSFSSQFYLPNATTRLSIVVELAFLGLDVATFA